jgi:predicted transcriptional regulator
MDLKQGDLENIILNALWDLEQVIATTPKLASASNGVSLTPHDEKTSDPNAPSRIFVGDIQNRIQTPTKRWAYTTVKTVLDRLVDKGLAEREKDGKKYLYRSLTSRNAAGRQALQKVLRQFFRNDMNDLLRCLYELPDAAHISLEAVIQKPPVVAAHSADKHLAASAN